MADHRTIYKIRTFSPQHLELAVGRQLYFASPGSLNDPLDCRIMIAEALQDLISRERDEAICGVWRELLAITTFNKDLKKEMNFHDALGYYISTRGVLSLTLTATDTLLWSHYGDGHRGIAYGFSESFFESLARNYDESKLLGVGDVVYCDVPPHAEIFRTAALAILTGREKIAAGKVNGAHLAEQFHERYRNELIIRTLTSKHSPWAYEREYRAVRKSPGPISFPADALVEVIFGKEATEDNRQKVRKYLSGKEFQHIRYREAYISPNSFELNLREV